MHALAHAGNRRLVDPLASMRRTRDQDISPFAHHRIHYGGPDGK